MTSTNVYTGASRRDDVDLVIAATGFRNLGPSEAQERLPPLLFPLAEKYRLDDLGTCRVTLDYSLVPVQPDSPHVFLNGLCETTHGMGDAGTFSLLSVRAKVLSDSIAARLGERAPSLQSRRLARAQT
jgi:L-ornithine N5-oxygenase